MKAKQLLAEASLTRIWQKLQNHSAGAITAFSEKRSKSENKKLNKELLAYMLRKGYSVVKVKGSYVKYFGTKDQVEVGEESFFVANMKTEGDDGGDLERDLVKLGKMYDQESILSVPHGKKGQLVGTSDEPNSFPGMGERVTVGYPKFGKADGEFFSRVRGRQFAFESVQLIEHPKTRNGKWAMSIMAEKVNKKLR